MIYLRSSQDRGYANHGWLKSFHSFSFAGYYDPDHMGWGNLRVINEDRIEAGTGFGAHPHRDMEIVSYVMQGALTHEDSMGNAQAIEPGDVQRMTAGTGIVHSEHNHAQGQTHFLQIWLQPSRTGLEPSYEQKRFTNAEKTNVLKLVAAPDGAQGSVHLNADARIFASLLRPEQGQTVQLQHHLAGSRKAYVFVIQGEVVVAGKKLTSGDALLAENEHSLEIQSSLAAEFLVFDLAA
jgi:quercetin 2,3-dioxygenase